MTCVIQYSRAARALVAGAAFATMALVLATPVAPHWQAVGVGWTGLVACLALRRLNVVQCVRVDEDGAIEVLHGERWSSGRVRPGCVVLPWLTVIHWRPPGGRFDRAVFLIASMVDPSVFRALRVALRWGKP